MTASTPSSAEDIAELFRGAIRSGQLGDGERLPTVRQTARDFAVAQATAAKAYKALEQSGFVVTRTAAGTRVAPGASPAPHSVIEHVRTLVEASTDAQVSLEDVIAIHADTIATEGGAAGLRDAGLLESAVLMPRQQFGGSYLHQDLAAMAAAYLFHIAANHAFIDGNKRTGAMAALVFLDANGVTHLPEPIALQEATLAVASGQMEKPQLIEWMRHALGT